MDIYHKELPPIECRQAPTLSSKSHQSSVGKKCCHNRALHRFIQQQSVKIKYEDQRF